MTLTGPDRTGSFRFIAVQGWMDCAEGCVTGARASSSPGTATTRASALYPPRSCIGSGRLWSKLGAWETREVAKSNLTVPGDRHSGLAA